MKTFIEYLIKHIVDKPEEVRVSEITGERIVVVELCVGDGDMGKVIGREGQTAASLRTVLAAAAARHGKRAALEILERNRIRRQNSQYENPAKEITARKPASTSQSEDESRWQDDGGNN